jgi:glutathione S-transferase
MWQRRMELNLLSNTAGSFRNTSEFFKGRIPQVPEYGEVCKNAAVKQLEWLDSELGKRQFIAGDRFTIADITALIGIDFGRTTGIKIQPNQTNLKRWYDAVSSRPSAKA